jgi:group I intron endonuclease
LKAKSKKSYWAGIVYVITNKVNGKQYVGLDTSCDPENHRWKCHINAAARGRSKYPLHRAIRKYGVKNFTAEIIQHCCTLKTLNAAERWWIKKLGTKTPNGYNLTDGGEGILGFVHTTRSHRKISVASKMMHDDPVKHANFLAGMHAPETKLKLSRAGKLRFKEMSVKDRSALRKKCSEAQLRRYQRPGARDVMRNAQLRRYSNLDERVRKSDETKAFWHTMTAIERCIYWRSIHSNHALRHKTFTSLKSRAKWLASRFPHLYGPDVMTFNQVVAIARKQIVAKK